MMTTRLILLLTLGVSSSFARAESRAWAALPSVAELEVPERFFTTLARHDLFRAGRALHGAGESLNFDFSMTFLGKSDGWGIQAGFLKNLLAHWFPRATFTPGEVSGRTRVVVRIYDSRMSGALEDLEIEMEYLKTVNPGFDLPNQGVVRERLHLPPGGRVASVYGAWTQRPRVPKLCQGLLEHGLADVVVVSMQDGSTPKVGDDGFTNVEWANLRSARPARAIVVNQTRGRLPWLHAAADYAVVLGEANAVEPLHQGTSTFLSRSLAQPNHRWDRYVGDLTELAGARAFDSSRELLDLLAGNSGRRPRGFLYEDARIMGRLLDQILTLIDRDATGGHR